MTERIIKSRDLTMTFMAFAALVASVGLLVFNGVRFYESAQQAAATHAAVCAFRDSIARQAEDGQRFLLQHPNGAPSLGLTAEQIQQTIDRQIATVKSLHALDCPTER